MNRPFSAYTGDEPYAFVSYSHRDSSGVYPELVWLKESGFNIWYDEGIEAGTEWREELAKAIEKAQLFIYFVSVDSVESQNCRKEVNFAVDENIPIVAIHLEPVALPSGLKLTLSDRQAILKHEIPIGEYQQKLLSRVASYLNQEITLTARVVSKRPMLTVGTVTILLAIGALASGLFFYNREGAQQNEIMSIDYRDEPVRRLVEDISDVAERNLIASDAIGGNITITLNDVTWREALDSVAISRGYDVRVTENTIFIAPRNLGEVEPN
jgi:hypothetical protein